MNELGWGQKPKRTRSRSGWWRGPLLLLVCSASLVGGFWFGGATERGVSGWAVAALGACVLLGDLLGSPDRWQSRLVAAVTMAILFAVGWYGGIWEMERSFEGCVERGEEVRQALAEHAGIHGRYPATLQQLEQLEIPGRRLLRPDLMRYAASDNGYLLEFADATVRMTATHERGFLERR